MARTRGRAVTGDGELNLLFYSLVRWKMRSALARWWWSAILALAVGCGGTPKDYKDSKGTKDKDSGTKQAQADGAKDKKDEQSPPLPSGVAKTETPPGRTDPATLEPATSFLPFVTDEYFAAGVIKPREILQSPVLKGLPLAMMLEPLQRDMGFDPMLLERAVLLMRPPQGRGVNRPIGIVRFADPADIEPTLKKLWGGFMKGEHLGRPIYTEVPPPLPEGVEMRGPRMEFAAADVGGGWVIMGEEEPVKRMSQGKGGTSPLAAKLKTVDPAADAYAVAVIEPIRDLAKRLAEEGEGEAPPQVLTALGVADLAETAVATLSLTGAESVRLIIQGKDPEAAEKVENMALALVGMGQAAYQQFRTEMAEQAGPAGEPVVKMTDEVVRAVKVARDGATVTVSVTRPAGMDTLAETMAPAIEEAQQAARRARRIYDLRQIGLAMHNYHDSFRAFPPAATRDKDGKPLLSWRVAILPYLEQGGLYEQFHLDEPWDSEHNLKLAQQMPDIYKCEGVEQGKTSIVVLTGEGVPFGGEKGPTMADIRDGSSNTIMCVEAGPDKAVPWTKPEDIPFNKQAPLSSLGKLPENHFLALFMDGHVQAVAVDVDSDMLSWMIQHNDGQPIDLPSP